MLQPRGDAGQVADAVAVAVGEAARVDLVDDAAAPPVAVLSHAEDLVCLFINP